MAMRQSIPFRGIYAIRHVASGKLYIGSAVNIGTRWTLHRRQLKAGRHHSKRMQRAWDLYGADAFVFEVLQIVLRREDLIRTEQEYLDHFLCWEPDHGYNTCRYADSSLGFHHSEESLAKIRNIHRNRSPELQGRINDRKRSAEVRAKTSESLTGHIVSEETRAKIAAAKRGARLTAEHRKKISDSQKGKMISPEAIAKTAAANRGRSVSAETRAKIAASLAGRKQSPEAVAKRTATLRSEDVREKIASSLRGRTLPPEVIAKLSAAHKGHPVSEETRAKISAKNKGRKRSSEMRAKMSESAKNRGKSSEYRPAKEQMTLFDI